MDKVIIGIHGLANKPEAEVLERWWMESILEGLNHIRSSHTAINFELVYWAGYLYKNSMHREEGYEFDDLYNSEPYIMAETGALIEHDDDWKDGMRKFVGQILGTSADRLRRTFNVDGVTNFVLSRKLKDLDYYYDERKQVKNKDGNLEETKTVLQAELESTLEKHAGKDIMLIAHSMGSIIAYDVLRNMGKTGSGVRVDEFVTIGSPLGVPYVKSKVVEERLKRNFADAEEVRTPTIISRSWTNFADPLDPVSLDQHLRDDYGSNDGGIKVRDDIVENDYVGEDGERNHHKSYGYLRTPELSKLIDRFL